MNIYIWRRVEKATGSWHSEGGVIAIAASEDRARELALAQRCEIAPDEHVDAVHELVGEQPEAVFIFPDAGCC